MDKGPQGRMEHSGGSAAMMGALTARSSVGRPLLAEDGPSTDPLNPHEQRDCGDFSAAETCRNELARRRVRPSARRIRSPGPMPRRPPRSGRAGCAIRPSDMDVAFGRTAGNLKTKVKGRTSRALGHARRQESSATYRFGALVSSTTLPRMISMASMVSASKRSCSTTVPSSTAMAGFT